MTRFIFWRLLQAIPIMLGLSILIFAWARALPGGPAEALAGEDATVEQILELEKALGLDRSILVQYGEFLAHAIRLDFGNSLQTNRPVTVEMLARFPATLELSVLALLFAISVGIPLGYLAARRYGTKLDNISVFISLVGITVPVFFMAYILKYIFSVKLGWLPGSGRIDVRIFTEHPTGFYVLDGIITGDFAAAWSALKHLALPAIALGSIPLALIARITRASVLDVVNEDYVRTAEAKGLLARTIAFRHILRNALIPIVTILGLQFGALISGTVLTETVFAFSGVGRFMADAIFSRDYPTIQGFVIVIGFSYILLNLFVDILYGLIDPRVRLT